MKRKFLVRTIERQCNAVKKRFNYDEVSFLPWTNGIVIKSRDDERNQVSRIIYFRYTEQALSFVLNYGMKEAKANGKEDKSKIVLQSR